jgi:predicted glycosyltransferase
VAGEPSTTTGLVDRLPEQTGRSEPDVTNAGSKPGAGVRLLMYSHDTFGLGHLRRCLKLSEAFSHAFPGMSILLVTGSPVVHRYALPPGVDYVKLPAVRKTGSENYEARLLDTSFERILRLRTEILRQTVCEYAPHLMLVDHSPSGMKGEMLPALKWLHEHRPQACVMLGLRDIIDDPAQVTDLWNREGIYDILEQYYDRVFIYGHPAVYDPVSEYRFPAGLRNKSVFCGYVTDQVTPTQEFVRKTSATDRPLVVVTIGGGDGAVDTVIEPYLNMLRTCASRVDFDTVILTGAFLTREQLGGLRRAAGGLPVSIRTHVTSTRSLLTKAQLVVATAGYNTTTDLLTFARRALLIPRIMHRKEQFIRARRLAELGLVRFLHPDHVTPLSLFDAIHEELTSGREPLSEARRRQSIPLNGCVRVIEECRESIAANRGPIGVVS